MRKIVIIIFPITILLIITLLHRTLINNQQPGAPPYGESEESAPDYGMFSWMNEWKRPNVNTKVALQVGHWKNNEFPEELSKLQGNTGAKGDGKLEWEVNLEIVKKTAELLNNKGINVEILPATVPPGYWADVFIAVHADGNTDTNKSGFKAAAPWRDFTGNADSLLASIEKEYKKATGLVKDDNITRNMRGYYAFSWWKYEHAIHPMTPAVILETGYLTNPEDRKIIVNQPEISARGLVNGITSYLETQNLLP